MNPAMLLPLVLAGHFIGDWVLATDFQATNKMKPGLLGTKAMFGHVFSYSVALGVCTIWAFSSSSMWKFAILIFVSAITHAFIDRRWPVRWLMRHTRRGSFSEVEWGVIATDQALHLSILCILVAILAR
jgi:hypothetical protein